MARSQEVERIAKKLDKMVQKKKTVSETRPGTFWKRDVLKNTSHQTSSSLQTDVSE